MTEGEELFMSAYFPYLHRYLVCVRVYACVGRERQTETERHICYLTSNDNIINNIIPASL